MDDGDGLTDTVNMNTESIRTGHATRRGLIEHTQWEGIATISTDAPQEEWQMWFDVAKRMGYSDEAARVYANAECVA